jgi:hypothetical protein
VFTAAGYDQVQVVAVQSLLRSPSLAEACEVLAPLPFIRTVADRLGADLSAPASPDRRPRP